MNELSRPVRAMCDAVKQAGVKTVVSFVLRWNPQFQWIDRMLDEGTLEIDWERTDRQRDALAGATRSVTPQDDGLDGR